MKYTYIISFKINGLSLPKDSNELIIDQSDRMQVILSSNLSKYSTYADIDLAIGSMMLRGLAGKCGEGEFEDRLEHEVNLIQQDRDKKYRNGPFIIFIARGETEVNLSRPTMDVGKFVITFDAVDKEKIKRSYKQLINQYLTSLFLVAKNDFVVNQVLEGFYLEEDHKIFYSYTFSSA